MENLTILSRDETIHVFPGRSVEIEMTGVCAIDA